MRRLFSSFRQLLCTLGICLSFAPFTPVNAQTPLTFCFEKWEPYTFIDENKKASGLSIHLIEIAAKKLDIAVKFVYLPWKRCLSSVENGRMDAVIDAAKRDVFLQGPTTLAYYTNTIWVHTYDALHTLPSLIALKERRAGYIDGYSYSPDYMSIPGVRIDYSPDQETVLRKLDAARVDFAVADYVTSKHLLKTKPLHVRELRPFPAVNPLYLSFHKSRVKEHRLFEATFKAMKEDGSVDAAYQAHIGVTLKDLIRSF